VNRIWSDASCGTQTYFDYPQNLLGAKDLFEKYGKYLDGSRAIVDVAVFFPTTEHRLRNQDWPQKTLRVANELRQCLDYDLLDERMIRDGALERYRVIVMCDGRVMEMSTLAALGRWLDRGGIIVRRELDTVQTVEGDRSAWDRIIGRSAGRVIALDADEGNPAGGLSGLGLPYFTERPATDVTATVFPDRILYLNSGDQAADLEVSLRPADFPKGGRTGVPESWEQTLHLEPHSIEHIDLK
jgi:hypothetical protein